MDKKVEFDQEVVGKVMELQKFLMEKGYDFLIVTSEKMTKESANKQPSQGFSCINYESEAPVLQSIITGLTTKDEKYMRFIRDLFFSFKDAVMSLGKRNNAKSENYAN